MIYPLILFRERTNQLYQTKSSSRDPKASNAGADSERVDERVPEDLAGRVCYELEPLVDAWCNHDSGSSFCLGFPFTSEYHNSRLKGSISLQIITTLIVTSENWNKLVQSFPSEQQSKTLTNIDRNLWFFCLFSTVFKGDCCVIYFMIHLNFIDDKMSFSTHQQFLHFISSICCDL